MSILIPLNFSVFSVYLGPKHIGVCFFILVFDVEACVSAVSGYLSQILPFLQNTQKMTFLPINYIFSQLKVDKTVIVLSWIKKTHRKLI